MSLKKFVANIIATFFYVGLIPVGPGTFGTLAAIPLFYALTFTPLYLYLAITVLIIFISVWASTVAEEIYGKHDPQQVVIDEVCGYLVTMILVPATPSNIFLGFLLFRLFDIFKPWPIKIFDAIDAGWAIVIDDLLAAAYAILSLILIGFCFF